MIKTFDQFITIEEGLFGSKKTADFYKQFKEMIDSCMDAMIKFVNDAGGEVDLTDADDNTIFVYEGEVNNKKNVTYAVELKGVKVVKGHESDYKNDKGESLVVTTSDDKEVPVDTTHVDDSSIFYLSSILASLKK